MYDPEQIAAKFTSEGGAYRTRFGRWQYELTWEGVHQDCEGWWLAWWDWGEDSGRNREDGYPIAGEDNEPNWGEVARVVHGRRYE